MAAFGNPVPGYIHPVGWKPPAGNLDFYVIRDCAGHQATNQGCALDINNGRCDGRVLAVGPGIVKYREDLQGIIRILHPDGTRSDYAHMKPILVVVGQQVTQGQQIGEIGDAHDPSIPNFSGCHLHFAVRLSWNGPEVDPWPLLKQNGATEEDEMIPIPVGQYKPLDNVKTSTLVPANFRSERLLGPNVIKLYPKDTVFVPVAQANDGAPAGGPTPTLWYSGFLYSDVVPQGVHFGWFHSSVLGTMIDTSPDCAAEVLKAVAPLEKRLKDINVISS